jgi:hypothetical protein
MSEWKPIETAAGDKEILGYQATPGDNEFRMAVCWPAKVNGNVVWFAANGLMPTHWMPLPDAPKI